MTDKLTPIQRHKNMAAIHGKDTKPEMVVRRYLWGHGFRYRLNHPRLPWKPDIVMRKYRACSLQRQKKSLQEKLAENLLFLSLVPRPGVEPGRVAPLVFETSASTDSAIWASQSECKDKHIFSIVQVFILKILKIVGSLILIV